MFRRVFCYISMPWYSAVPIFYSYLTYILTYNLRLYRAYLLTFILASMQYFIWHAMIWYFIWQYLTIYIWHMFWHCKSGFLSGILSVVFESGEVSNKLATKPAMTCGPSPLTIRSAAQLCSNGFEWTHSIFASEGPMTFSLQGLQGFQPIPTLEGAVPLHKWQLLSELGVKLHGHRIILQPNCTPPRAGLTGR